MQIEPVILVEPLEDGGIPKTPTLPNHFSYSSMNNFQQCPRKWFYAYIARAKKEFVPASLVFGGSLRAALQAIHRGLVDSGELLDLNAAFGVYEAHWSRDAEYQDIRFSGSQTREGFDLLARSLLEKYLDDHAGSSGQIIGIEESVNLNLPGMSVPVVGKIDLLVETETALVVADAKTARNAYTPDKLLEAKAQLALYAESVRPMAELWGKTVRGKFIVFRLLKKPRIEVVDVELTAADLNRSTGMMRETWKLIEAAFEVGSFPPKPGWMCKGCPFRERCEHDLSEPQDARMYPAGKYPAEP